MLEAGYTDLFDQEFQRGIQIGRADAHFIVLTEIIRGIRAIMSEKRWERFKKSEEQKYRKYRKEHPGREEDYSESYDREGHLVKEKWIEEQKRMMEGMHFPEEAWEELRGFAEKYPGLLEEDLARRVLRESEYKYI